MCLTDPHERCNELSCEVFLQFLQHFDAEKTRKALPVMIQILSRKLSSEDEYEPSEEVRMKMLDLISYLLETFSQDMTVHAEDIVDILLQTLLDDCPSIKRMSAQNISKLKINHRRCLKKKGQSLVPPLAKNLIHRHTPAVIVGYMLDPKIWTPFMIQRLREDPSNHLLILGGLIKGSQRDKIKDQVKEIARTIADNSVCLALEEDHQEEVLQCLEAILETCKEDAEEAQSELFKLSLVVISLSSNELKRERARDCQQKIMKLAALDSLELLYKSNVPVLFEAFVNSSPTWSSVSYEKLMFEAVLHECGMVAGHFPGLVVTIFRNILSNENDPESGLKSFILLNKMLLNTSSTLDSQGTFAPYLLSVVKDIISPALKWKAGRTASAIRTAAASSLWSSIVAASSLTDGILQLFKQTVN